MGDLLELPARTYRAELFEVRWETGRFAVAGTLDGFIDLACPNAGTYVLNIEEARRLAELSAGRSLTYRIIACMTGTLFCNLADQFPAPPEGKSGFP